MAHSTARSSNAVHGTAGQNTWQGRTAAPGERFLLPVHGRACQPEPTSLDCHPAPLPRPMPNQINSNEINEQCMLDFAHYGVDAVKRCQGAWSDCVYSATCSKSYSKRALQLKRIPYSLSLYWPGPCAAG